MQKAESRLGNWWKVIFCLIALLIVAADQLSKLWIRSYSETQVIFEAGILRITSVQNTGSAFGLLQDQRLLLTIVAFVGITLVLLFIFIVPRYFPIVDTRVSKITLGLVLGGAIGNLIDRLRFGYVTDFVSIGFWPAFNVADSALVVGTILFAYFFLFSPGMRKA